VGGVDGAAFKIDAVQRRLDNDVLLGVNGAADFMPFAGRYVALVAQAA
jgi:hypothetical protein